MRSNNFMGANYFKGQPVTSPQNLREFLAPHELPKMNVARSALTPHIQDMVANVTNDGLLIPRRLLRGIKRVELRRGKSRITLFSAKDLDPIAQLGSKPVTCGVRDGSTNHDQHLYNGKA
jgi:hypothetical protein